MKTTGKIVGIDMGKREYVLRYVDGDGKVKGWKGGTSPEERAALIRRLGDDDIVSVEAGSLAFLIGREADKAGRKTKFVYLSTNKLAVIYRSLKKTDKEDALKLAKMAMQYDEGDLPTVRPATEKELERREMISEHRELKSERTRLVNRLHAEFMNAGLTGVVKKDVATRSKREESAKLLPSGSYAKSRVERLMKLIDEIEKELCEVEALMEQSRKGDEEIEKLEGVPGVGPLTALAFMAYMGGEKQFSSLSQASSFVGLVPRMDVSCTIKHVGHITKSGNGYLRSLLYQAAWSLVRCKKGSFLKEKYKYMVANGKGKKKAITATARKLCELMYSLIKNKRDYSDRAFVPPKSTVSALSEQALSA